MRSTVASIILRIARSRASLSSPLTSCAWIGTSAVRYFAMISREVGHSPLTCG